MLAFVFALILLAIAITALLLEKVYFYIPLRELKRRAAAGHRQASLLYQAAAYGADLKLLLWIVTGLCAAGGLVLFSQVAPIFLGFIAIVLVLWLAFLWLPQSRPGPVAVSLAEWAAPALSAVLRWFHILVGRFAPHIAVGAKSLHTGLYEPSDLEELISHQRSQRDNRINDDQLELMQQALQFGHYTVGAVTVPQRKVVTVSIDDTIGPVLLDELHKSGHVYFPVYEGQPSNPVGLLGLDDVENAKQGGMVADYYRPRLAYVHEDDSLREALQAFYDTRQHMLFVVNDHNEYVGILTLSDILAKLFTAIQPSEARARHEDRQAVAGRRLAKQPNGNTPVGETPTEVVE